MQEPVDIYSGPGFKLSAVVHRPEMGKSERRAAIVLCGGYASAKEIYMPRVAESFQSAGYVVLNFDYRGFGRSEGPRYRLLPQEQVEDIQNCLTYLETRTDVDSERMGLWGMSFGGGNCVYAAAQDQRAKCVVSCVGVGNGERWLHSLMREPEWHAFLKRLDVDRHRRVTTGASERVHPYDIMVTNAEGWGFWKKTVEIYPERAKVRIPLESADHIIRFKPEEVVHRIAPRPVLFVSAEEDSLTPVSEQLSMFERAGEPKKHVVLQGVGHGLYEEGRFDELMRLSVEWFERYLK